MPAFVALLRAVNVGGTGALPMALLREACGAAGLAEAQTYLASGNAVFRWNGEAAAAGRALEGALAARVTQAPVVLIRSGEAIGRIVAENPFPDAPADRVAALVHGGAATDSLAGMTGLRNEELRPAEGRLYILYPDGMGRSRLRLPSAEGGTARNMRTMSALAGLLAKLDAST